jgi:predicted nuclease with TOPRIM domain
MNLDDYVARMAAAHDEFTQAMLAMQRAYGKTQTIFTDLMRDVRTSNEDLRAQLADLRESNEELRRLILDQGAQIRDLRDRLNGRP